MEQRPQIKTYSFTLDCQDPHELASFYARLLGWDIVYENEDFSIAGAPGAGQGEYPGLTFQRNPAYIPPVWPDEPDAQQQMAHLDFAVSDLEESVRYASPAGRGLRRGSFPRAGASCLTPPDTLFVCA